MSSSGFIKLHRKIVDWEWYDDLNTFKLWIHILLKVNHDDKKWRGEVIKRGSCISSYSSLSTETGLTVQQVRSALSKLISTNDITKLSRTKNTLFIVTNYNSYQDAQQTNNKQITNNQQTTQQTSNTQLNKQVTTNKNEKNIKNIKNKENKESNKESKEETFDDIIAGYTDSDILKNNIAEFIKMRLLIKKKLTNYSLKLILKKLFEISSSDDERIEILNNSIMNNWQGIFPLKEKYEDSNKEQGDLEESDFPEIDFDTSKLENLMDKLEKGEL